MSESKGAGGGICLITLIGGVYAYATIPSLTGLKGAFAAAMVGAGTSLSSSVYGIGGAVAGLVIGGLAGAAVQNPKAGAILGTIVCGLGAACYGIPVGYGHAKDIIVNGTSPKAPAVEKSHTISAYKPQFYKA